MRDRSSTSLIISSRCQPACWICADPRPLASARAGGAGRARAAGRSRASRSAACAARGSCARGNRSSPGSTTSAASRARSASSRRRCSVMSSTTPTMRHGSPLRVAQQRDRRAHPDTSPGARDVALVAPVHRDLAARPAAPTARSSSARSSGCVQRRRASCAASSSLAVAGQLAEARIGLLDAAVQVGVDDADRHVVEDVAKALLARAQRRLGAPARSPTSARSAAVRSRTALSMRRVRPVVISSERAEHRRRQQADDARTARRCGRAPPGTPCRARR